MKTFLPWLLAVLALAGAALLFKAHQTQATELEKLRVAAQELAAVRAELSQLESQQVPAVEITQLRKDREDLLRLRNEVGKLRKEKQELTRQAQAAQASLANALAETQRAQQQAQAAAQASQAQALASTQITAQALDGCIHSLGQLDNAKLQWALENGKADGDVPSARDLAPYLKDQVIPTCPAGGAYALNPVGTAPTCSLPGHVLPPPAQ